MTRETAATATGALAASVWQGLENHGVKAYTDLSCTKKEALKNALELHYPSTTKNCPE